MGGWMTLLWQGWLGVRKGDGNCGIVGVGGWVELRSVSGVAGPLAGVLSGNLSSSTVLHAWVVVVWGGLLLDVVWMVGVRPTQHQLPTQSGKARDWSIRDWGAFHTAGHVLWG